MSRCRLDGSIRTILQRDPDGWILWRCPWCGSVSDDNPDELNDDPGECL